MQRFHVHVAVESLAVSVQFYSRLFAAEPTVLKADYAKWMLEDPRVNFAISQRGAASGIDHLGIEVESRAELADVEARLERAGGPAPQRGPVSCCYAESEKSWLADPQGVHWEIFLTTGQSAVYGVHADPPARLRAPRSACCAAACSVAETA